MYTSPRRRLLDAADPGTRLASWLRHARQRGMSAVYWNAAPISLDEALARAGRLAPGANVDLQEGRVLVVEPLQRPTL